MTVEFWLRRMAASFTALFVSFGAIMLREGLPTAGVVLLVLGLGALAAFATLVMRDDEMGRGPRIALIVTLPVLALLLGAVVPL